MRKFTEKIKEQQLKLNIIISLKYLLLIVAILLLIFNLFMAVYFMSEGYVGEKFLFALSLKITLALTILYLALKLNRELISRQQAARILDKRNLDRNDSFQNAQDLLLEQGETENPILQEIYRTADELAQQQRLKYDFSLLRRLTIIVGIVLLGNLILAFTADSAWHEAVDFFALRSLPEVQHKDYIELQPGNATLLRGSSLQVELIDPEQNLQHNIFYRQHQVWRQDQMVQGSYSFTNLENSTEYFVENEFVRSDTFYLEVLEIPALKQIIAKIDFPAYTNLPSRQDSSGNISLLEGSRLSLKIEANNPLETAQLVWNEQIYEMQRLGISTFSHRWQPQKGGKYYFNLQDILGNSSQKIEYVIKLKPDEIPQVEILQPVADTVLTQNMLLPLLFVAADDFALQDLELHYYKNSQASEKRILRQKIGKSILRDDYLFDLGYLNLFPGDQISFWLEVTDNKPQAQRGKSTVRQVRLPSIEEIYDEVAAEEQANRERMDEAKERSEGLNERLQEKRRELMKRDELNWDDKKELENFLQEQTELNESVEKLAEDYRQTMDKLEQNQALSNETLEKMERISELMQEISNEDLRQAMQKMQDSLDKMQPEDVKQALDELKFSMEEFSEKLEQTLKMLEEIKKEQALQKASEIAKEMQQMQEELNKQTSEESESNQSLSEKQQAISEKSEALQQEMENASELMQGENDAEMKQKLDQLLQEMEELRQELQEAAENLQSQQKKTAMEQQQNATEMMQQMNRKLSEMNQQMNMMGMQINAESLDLARQRLQIWSSEHERLTKSYQQDPYLILRDLIANFEGTEQSLQELYSTPMIFLLLGPKFMYDANRTIASYQDLFQHINDGGRNQVDDYLVDIQQGLNLMIYDLILAKNNLQNSSGSGGGMQSLMQQMQQMGEEQMMLNMLTSQMLKEFGKSGKMSHEMRQELGKLAADEQRLADNLKRAIQSDPTAQKQAQSLNRIAEELESISRDLQRGRINSEVIKSQERILSRLLDVQKSIHQREFSKQREAESSEIDSWDTPAAIQQKFEKMRRRALLEEEYKIYAPQYQELIKEYLRKINEE